jgi:hypothetical protein
LQLVAEYWRSTKYLSSDVFALSVFSEPERTGLVGMPFVEQQPNFHTVKSLQLVHSDNLRISKYECQLLRDRLETA